MPHLFAHLIYIISRSTGCGQRLPNSHGATSRLAVHCRKPTCKTLCQPYVPASVINTTTAIPAPVAAPVLLVLILKYQKRANLFEKVFGCGPCSSSCERCRLLPIHLIPLTPPSMLLYVVAMLWTDERYFIWLDTGTRGFLYIEMTKSWTRQS